MQPRCDFELMDEKAREHLLKSAEIKHAAANSCIVDITKAAQIMIETLERKGKILLCGNGGSAADCQHIATEFTSVLSRDFKRPALSAIALTTDTSFITANANDFGFEGIFERQVEAIGRPGDSLIGISTSGNSENVLRAVNFARGKEIRTIALTGKGGGKLATIAEFSIKVPSDETQLIQESHISIGHVLCELVEIALFKQN